MTGDTDRDGRDRGAGDPHEMEAYVARRVNAALRRRAAHELAQAVERQAADDRMSRRALWILVAVLVATLGAVWWLLL